MAKATIFGITIDDPSLVQILSRVDDIITHKQVRYITTINSELLQLSQTVPAFRAAIIAADMRLCDGIGIQWAAAFNQHPHPRWVNVLRAPLSLIRLLVQPSSARAVIKHRTAGRLLFEDVLAHASQKGYSVFFLGAGPGVAAQAARQAKDQHPGLAIAGSFDGNPEVAEAIMKNLKPSNILFVAYGSPKQEIFIHQYLDQLQSNVVVGVGGTFDAYVGAKPIGSAWRQVRPPQWVHRLGLESFWRLITQPNRYKRVWKSVVVLAAKVAWTPSADGDPGSDW